MPQKASVPIADLSPNSARMLALRDDVLSCWENSMRDSLPQAKHMSSPVLIDLMPVLYEQMCCLLTEQFFTEDGLDAASFGGEHGQQRGNLADYDHDALLAEFQIFRRVLFDTLEAKGLPVSWRERRALHLSIDSAARTSMLGFVEATNTHRERHAAALAHDLRQPLANVSAAADLIVRQVPSPQAVNWAQLIMKNSARMSSMLEEMLDTLATQHHARMKLALAEFDLAELARAVVLRAQNLQKATIAFRSSPVVGFWNHAALERSLENLLNNALKYGGTEKPIEVTVAQHDQRAILSVRNYGPPIPPGQFEAIFQQYVRADDTAGSRNSGWGIGLPYVRTIAQSHGGTIVVFSEQQTGTVFIIDIPLDARQFQEPDGKAAA
jgi:signal transduction histidine kinase